MGRSASIPAIAALVLCLLGCSAPGVPAFPTIGEPCDPSGTDTCVDGFCLRLEDSGICSVACSSDHGCPAGLSCQVDVPLQALVCKPGSRCVDDAGCPSGHRCDRDRSVCYIPVARGLCAPCTSDAQCPAGGVCLRAAGTGERFCTSPCEAGSCPDGYRCRTLDPRVGTEEGPRQCVPEAESCYAGKPLCAPCRGDVECADGNARCVENLLTRERFCGISCSPSCVWDDDRGQHVDSVTDAPCRSGCPRNFSCTELPGAEGEIYQCVPNSHTCEGYCDSDNPLDDRLQCGPGRRCDRLDHLCVPATDGRACASCTDDDQCNPPGSEGGAVCLVNTATHETFCAPSCEVQRDCATALGLGFSCVDVEGSRVCAPSGGSCESGRGRLGDSCANGGDSDCMAGICLRYGSLGLCSGPCMDDASCGDTRYRCCPVVSDVGGATLDCLAPIGPSGGVCAPKDGSFGDDCEAGRPPCLDGYCLNIGSAQFCTASCSSDADCDLASRSSGAFDCREAQVEGTSGSAAEAVKICFPAGGGEIGSDCSFGPAACAGRLCLKKESGNVCTQGCADKDCPAGWTCTLTTTVDGRPDGDGAPMRVCVP